MQRALLQLLVCPISQGKLELAVLSEFEKEYLTERITEIKDGLLFSDAGFIYPIINGVPRMLPEAMYDYETFIRQHYAGYTPRLEQLEADFKGLLSYCISKNKRTKKSFELEWSFLNNDKNDRIWQDDVSRLTEVFVKETGHEPNYFSGKTVIDIGCGHGVMTGKIADISERAIGIELSNAVERAYNRNKNKNAMYLQGDVQFLPFKPATFDTLYSSGVIHHTNNTELSLALAEPLLKPGGNICLWLYQPQKSIIQFITDRCRRVMSRLPIYFSLVLLMTFVLPFSLLVKFFKRKKTPNWREEIIDLMDSFTPEFRHETSQDQARFWLSRRGYNDIMITTENQFGFAIAAQKRDRG